MTLPRGTRFECTAHCGNSAANPENADPARKLGRQSCDELLVDFFNLVFDVKMPVENLFADRTNGAGMARN
jgi:hypothetical protein